MNGIQPPSLLVHIVSSAGSAAVGPTEHPLCFSSASMGVGLAPGPKVPPSSARHPSTCHRLEHESLTPGKTQEGDRWPQRKSASPLCSRGLGLLAKPPSSSWGRALGLLIAGSRLQFSGSLQNYPNKPAPSSCSYKVCSHSPAPCVVSCSPGCEGVTNRLQLVSPAQGQVLCV